jgi:hypothetical protein
VPENRYDHDLDIDLPGPSTSPDRFERLYRRELEGLYEALDQAGRVEVVQHEGQLLLTLTSAEKLPMRTATASTIANGLSALSDGEPSRIGGEGGDLERYLAQGARLEVLRFGHSYEARLTWSDPVKTATWRGKSLSSRLWHVRGARDKDVLLALQKLLTPEATEVTRESMTLPASG